MIVSRGTMEFTILDFGLTIGPLLAEFHRLQTMIFLTTKDTKYTKVSNLAGSGPYRVGKTEAEEHCHLRPTPSGGASRRPSTSREQKGAEASLAAKFLTKLP